jgi:hypothetical protein
MCTTGHFLWKTEENLWMTLWSNLWIFGEHDHERAPDLRIFWHVITRQKTFGYPSLITTNDAPSITFGDRR